jgi:hypothetical protein
MGAQVFIFPYIDSMKFNRFVFGVAVTRTLLRAPNRPNLPAYLRALTPICFEAVNVNSQLRELVFESLAWNPEPGCRT